jgi:hypothetical protein
MSFRIHGVKLTTWAGDLRRALRYAAYDWAREMSKPRRLVTFVAILMQGYAVYCILVWALSVPDWLQGLLFVLPRGGPGYLLAFYVNAGHNAPIVCGHGSTTFLEASGLPLGLFPGAEYEAGTAVVPPGGVLLLFTDGLTDAIRGENPAERLRGVLADDSGITMATLESLMDPELNEDDVTILLLKRAPGSASSEVLRADSLVQSPE